MENLQLTSQSTDENYDFSSSNFKEALAVARINLDHKKRISGDSYFERNLRVVATLIENKAEPDVIIAGMLHGVIGKISREEIISSFNAEVYSLLQGMEELKEIKSKNPALNSNSLKKIILATLKDARVILIKLALKLDSLRSISVFPKEEQIRIAQEVLDVYAPLAYRLGIERIRVKLDDLAFSILNLCKFQEICNFLEQSREQREKDIEEGIKLIKDKVKDKVKMEVIKGRPKHIYSIYKKMIDKKISLNQLYDLLGVRIIVPEVSDCYILLGILHENFEPLDGRLKDYITNPKANFYRSLHTGILLPFGKKLEVQIRTKEMDQFAEEGLAAHWSYKGLKSDQLFEKKIAWLRSVLDLQRSEGNKEHLEKLKLDLFGDKIYCYTPKGDVKELPREATVLDFAFLIHEEVGSQCIGARVNGKFVPIRHKLSSGDIIEVLTNKNQRPRRNWIKIVASARAKQKIRKSLKIYEKLSALHYHSWKPVIKEEQGVLVHCEDFPKASCVLAKCCHALPGGEIVGIATKRRIISVHKQDCRLALKEENRWVLVNWREVFHQKIRFYIEAEERSGVLADLLHTIALAGFEVKEAKAKLLNINYAQCSFSVIPRNLDHLRELVKRVEKVESVKKIYFE